MTIGEEINLKEKKKVHNKNWAFFFLFLLGTKTWIFLLKKNIIFYEECYVIYNPTQYYGVRKLDWATKLGNKGAWIQMYLIEEVLTRIRTR